MFKVRAWEISLKKIQEPTTSVKFLGVSKVWVRHVELRLSKWKPVLYISCPSYHWEWVIWWTSLEFGERFATFGCAASVLFLFLFFKSSNLKDCQLWAQSKRRFKRWSERHCKQCCHLGFNSQLIQCCLMCGRLECWTESETGPGGESQLRALGF